MNRIGCPQIEVFKSHLCCPRCFFSNAGAVSACEDRISSFLEAREEFKEFKRVDHVWQPIPLQVGRPNSLGFKVADLGSDAWVV